MATGCGFDRGDEIGERDEITGDEIGGEGGAGVGVDARGAGMATDAGCGEGGA